MQDDTDDGVLCAVGHQLLRLPSHQGEKGDNHCTLLSSVCVNSSVENLTFWLQHVVLLGHPVTKGLTNTTHTWPPPSPTHTLTYTSMAVPHSGLTTAFEVVLGFRLLQSYFYVTESSVHHNRVFYYRKPVWRRICKLAATG